MRKYKMTQMMNGTKVLNRCLCASLAAATLCALPMNAMATEKINNVSVKFEMEDVDEGMPAVDVDIDNDKYSGFVSSAAEYYGGEGEYAEDPNIYIVELQAEDDWYFNITKQSGIHLSGAGAEFIKASRRNNGQTLIITARLTDLSDFIEEVPEAGFKENGYGEWEEAYGALTYRLAITDPKGKAKYATTGGTTYDFRPFMQKEGEYRFRVRPISESGKMQGWTDGGYFTVTPEMAAVNRENFEVKKDISFLNGEKTPANQIITYLNTGWQKTDGGQTWYRNQDGSYPQRSWQQDGDDWYFFDENGYMVTSDYIEWGSKDYYVGADGKMIVSARTPDGRKAGADGILF